MTDIEELKEFGLEITEDMKQGKVQGDFTLRENTPGTSNVTKNKKAGFRDS